MDAPLTDTLDPPELVMLALSVILEPIFTVLKFRAVGVPVRDPGVTPTAFSATLIEGFVVASLAMLRLPLTEPALVGAKVIDMAWLWPAPSVKGSVTPLIPNPLPLATA